MNCENLEEKRSLLKKIGSDFRITGQKPLISLQNPWALSAKKAEFISMSSFYEKVRTFFLDGNR
jgi:hypothetical protein